MKKRHKKLSLVLLGLAGIGISVALVLNAFSSNLVFYYTPTQIVAGEAPTNRVFRMGGLVEHGSIVRDGLKVRFTVTDLKERYTVHYEGILPDLFREGQGVVTQGRLQPDNTFVAQQVLAKHDENYMPPEVAQSLKPPAAKP